MAMGDSGLALQERKTAENDAHSRVVQRLTELKKLSCTEIEKMERSLLKAQTYAKIVMQVVHQPLVVLNEELRVILANPSFCKTFRVPVDETEGRPIYELCDRQWDIPKMQELLEKVLPEKNQVLGFEMEHDFSTIGPKTMLLNAQRVSWSEEGSQTILLSFDDITDVKRAEGVLREIPEAVAKQIEKRTSSLKASHKSLQKEVTERSKSEEELRQTCETLRDELKKRTADMQATQEKFQKEIAERQQAEEGLRKNCETLERALQKRSAEMEAVRVSSSGKAGEAEEMLRRKCETLDRELEKRTQDLEAARQQLKAEIEERRKAVELLQSLEEHIDNVFNSIEDKLVEVGLEAA